jgi:hypothetical protein
MTIQDTDFRAELARALLEEGDPAALVFENYLRWKGAPEYLVRMPPDGEDALVSRRFAVLAYPANPLFTTYATLGGSWRVIPGSRDSFGDARGVRYEYVFHAPHVHESAACELLVLVAEHPHRHGVEIGPGFVLPIGEPVVSGAGMEYLYFTYPYLDDGRLYEAAPFGQIDRAELLVQWLWALPIYRSEAVFIRERGPEAFEELLQARHSERYDAYEFLRPPLV